MAVIPIRHGGEPAAAGAAVRERVLCVADMLALTLGRWLFVGDMLCIPAVHSLLVIRALCSSGLLYLGCMEYSAVES